MTTPTDSTEEELHWMEQTSQTLIRRLCGEAGGVEGKVWDVPVHTRALTTLMRNARGYQFAQMWEVLVEYSHDIDVRTHPEPITVRSMLYAVLTAPQEMDERPN